MSTLERVFERFTPQTRRVLVLAQEEARLLNHGFIGTEHLLLGLIHEGEGVAADALERGGISLEAVRNEVEGTVGPTSHAPGGSPPFTPRAKKVLEFALRECIQLGHRSVGTEHLLLGLVREGEGVAAQVLVSLGVDLGQLRLDVIRLIPSSSEQPEPASEGVVAEAEPRCPRCRSGLLETARYRMIAVPAQDSDSGDTALSIAVVYCSRCGTALGNVDMGRGLG